jgi:tripartite-type tricarboxylate transporter receptor subunit TctC
MQTRHAKSRRGFLTLAGLAAVAGLQATVPAQAADWRPAKPIRILVGFAPGGSSDTVARLIAPGLASALGQQVIVENKPGAGGALAADMVAKAAPDGTTWLLAPSGHGTMAAMRATLPFKPVADFAWVSTVTRYPMVFAVKPDSKVRDLADLLATARAKTGSLTYSSVGVGTAHHLIGEWLNAETGANLVHVPFKGGTAAATEVMAGRVDLLVETMTLAMPMVRSGQLRGLAVTSAAPVASLPGVPTASVTVQSLQYESWLGVATTGGTPPEAVSAIHAALVTVLGDPAIKQRLSDLGGGAAPSTPQEFKARVERDIERFTQVVASRKIARQ